MAGVNLHYQAAQKFARSMASNVDLTVKVSKDIATAATDGKYLYIRPYEPHWQRGSDMDMLWYGLVAHECFHNLPENRADLPLINKDKRFKENPLFGIVHNITVDHNIEAGTQGRWPGADQWIRHARDTFGQLDRATLPKDPLEKSCTLKLAALGKMDSMCRNNWQGTALKTDIDDDVKPYYDQIKHLRDEYEQVRAGGTPNLDLAQRIYDLLNMDVEHKGLSEAAQEKMAGAVQVMDNHGDGDGEGEETVYGKHIDGEGNLKDTKAEAYANPEPDFQKQGYKPRDMVVKELTASGDGGIEEEAALSNKLVKRLQIYSRKRYMGGQKRGKLHMKRLPRVLTQGDTRVFRKRTEEIIKDTAVLLLVDCSGSMGGEKYRYATQSALSLIKVLDKNRISVGCYGFSYSDKPIHLVFKDFNDKANLEDISGKFHKASRDLRDNSDGDNVLHCYKILKKQRQKRKVMIVLSDGRPCAPPSGVGVWAKDVIKSVDSDPTMELYGIGICDSHVKELYKRAAVINSPSDLEPVLLNLLETIIIN